MTFGNYRVIVTNDNGSTTSAVAVLSLPTSGPATSKPEWDLLPDLPAGQIGVPYAFDLNVKADLPGAVPPIFRSATSFSMTGQPTGLVINPTTGEITGTPAAIKSTPYAVTVTARNAFGSALLKTRILINPLPTGALGVFTGPMVAVLLALSAGLPGAFGAYPAKAKIVALVELHVAVALVAYAAFAMAAVTGVMYLLQERMLKSHKIGQMFFPLPPIRELARAILRLVLLGLGLLSVALGLTFALEPSVAVTGSKVVFAWGVWGLYAVIAVLMWRHVMAPRRMAWLAVAGFILPFVSLWIVS
jgi:hypothetical protein